MKYRAQWSQTPSLVEVCEAVIEAADSDEALQKFLNGDFERYLVTSQTQLEAPDIDFTSIKWLKEGQSVLK